jgi:hypothetical protein
MSNAYTVISCLTVLFPVYCWQLYELNEIFRVFSYQWQIWTWQQVHGDFIFKGKHTSIALTTTTNYIILILTKPRFCYNIPVEKSLWWILYWRSFYMSTVRSTTYLHLTNVYCIDTDACWLLHPRTSWIMLGDFAMFSSPTTVCPSTCFVYPYMHWLRYVCDAMCSFLPSIAICGIYDKCV